MPPGDSPRVADLGELALLERIAARVARAAGAAGAACAGPPPGDVVLGIGDDTAALRWTPGALVLATTDALVEGVHFRRATSAAPDVGWKALAINASDIAAMGGIPRYAVISLMLPGDLDAFWVDGLYDGLLEMAGEAGVVIVGGNLAQSPVIVVDVTLLGEVAPERLVRRTGARPGDLLAVTGTLGRAAAGLVVLESLGDTPGGPPGGPRTSPDDPALGRLVAAQRRPWPRLREGVVLAETGAVRAMIDLSDGLGLDLWRMCEAGILGVRVEVDRVPVDPGVRQVVEWLADAPSASVSAGTPRPDPLDLALYGGEDYELLFAVDPGEADRVFWHLAEQTGTIATTIGTIEKASAGRVLVIGGRPMALDPGGWAHFKGDLR